MSIQIPTTEIAEKITEKLPHGDRALFVIVAVFVIAIIWILWFFTGHQSNQRDAFLQQIDKQAEISDRREQRTMMSIDKLSDSINQNTRIMDEVLDELKNNKN